MTSVSPAKTAELIKMLFFFEVWTHGGPRNHVLTGGPDFPTERGTCGGNTWAIPGLPAVDIPGYICEVVAAMRPPATCTLSTCLFRHVCFMRMCDRCIFRLLPYFCVFQQRVRIAYFFPHKLAFLTAILILLVFLLPISTRFCYLDDLVAMCPSIHVSGPL